MQRPYVFRLKLIHTPLSFVCTRSTSCSKTKDFYTKRTRWGHCLYIYIYTLSHRAKERERERERERGQLGLLSWHNQVARMRESWTLCLFNPTFSLSLINYMMEIQEALLYIYCQKDKVWNPIGLLFCSICVLNKLLFFLFTFTFTFLDE